MDVAEVAMVASLIFSRKPVAMTMMVLFLFWAEVVVVVGAKPRGRGRSSQPTGLIHAEAAEYTVGEADGWDTGINYLLWSNKYNFTVGDVLVFKYVQVQHNVYQVTQETYQSCDSNSGVIRTYDSGDDRVTLGEATSYWFICTITGHCQDGMKLAVSVANSSSDGGAAPSPPEQVNGAAGGRMGWWWKAWMLCSSLCLLTWLNC
ncbi:hypothetical protein OPV22_032289 [Ensete ventricosum]|uniref:Phytocyanin domain-containing protein n=1 Tax=Ensete ventricosum TaxID=4639 RepID=A0AAV8PXU6_ENSVE|nr:hypothetical protein OPV22_032289 [Ensete ventricosum]